MPGRKPNPSDAASVPASADALDDRAATRACPLEVNVAIEAFKQEERFARKLKLESEKSRATSAAFRYEHLVKDHYADDPAFFQWDKNRSLDRQNFDYLFYHRKHFTSWARTCLEIIASKLTHVTLNGNDGYFKKLERNVGWVGHITPIVFGAFRYMDQLVRCGLWSSASNSRRCHKPDLCPLCLWNDHLKVLVQAFGERSGAFARARAWWFLTLGFTSNPNNSKWLVKDFEPHVPNPGDGDRAYDPYPVELAQEAPYIGYTDARILGLVVQEALDEVYQSGLVDGYRNKLEGAFQINPGADTRMNLHGHAVANGSETNPDFIAEQLYTLMQQGLRKYRRHICHGYYPDVQVCPLASASDLERCICYSEKIVPVARIVADAMARPEASRPDGSWNAAYVIGLEESLCQLLNEDIPYVFTKFRYDQELLYLRRRKSVGNMTFTDSGTCIGDEPGWHKKARQKKSKDQRAKREERRRDQVQAKANGTLVLEDCKRKRSRKNPRRLKRSLEQQPRCKRQASAAHRDGARGGRGVNIGPGPTPEHDGKSARLRKKVRQRNRAAFGHGTCLPENVHEAPSVHLRPRTKPKWRTKRTKAPTQSGHRNNGADVRRVTDRTERKSTERKRTNQSEKKLFLDHDV